MLLITCASLRPQSTTLPLYRRPESECVEKVSRIRLGYFRRSLQNQTALLYFATWMIILISRRFTVASLRLVSPGAATDGDTYFPLILVGCHPLDSVTWSAPPAPRPYSDATADSLFITTGNRRIVVFLRKCVKMQIYSIFKNGASRPSYRPLTFCNPWLRLQL